MIPVMPRFLEVRRILVPVDFSESARKVLDYGLDIARDRGAEVVLLHVVGLPVAPFDPGYGVAADPRLLDDLRTEGEKALADLAAKAAAGAGKGVPLRTKIVSGAPSREIVREAREGGFDLVVIGTHGRTGLKHVFLGSVAENVVRLSPCPVVTVRLKGFEIERL
jgi:nucleotide-binding universal stress UspA family protein